MEKLLFILICVSFVVCWRTIMSIGTYFLTKSDALIDDVNRRDLTYPSIKADNTYKFLFHMKITSFARLHIYPIYLVNSGGRIVFVSM